MMNTTELLSAAEAIALLPHCGHTQFYQLKKRLPELQDTVTFGGRVFYRRRNIEKLARKGWKK